jgi:IclR family acetate operon transcriptional repressor
MKIRVDRDADAVFLRLDDSAIVASREVSPGVILDHAARDQVSASRAVTYDLDLWVAAKPAAHSNGATVASTRSVAFVDSVECIVVENPFRSSMTMMKTWSAGSMIVANMRGTRMASAAPPRDGRPGPAAREADALADRADLDGGDGSCLLTRRSRFLTRVQQQIENLRLEVADHAAPAQLEPLGIELVVAEGVDRARHARRVDFPAGGSYTRATRLHHTQMPYESLRKVLRLLDAFSAGERLLGVSDLAARTGLDASAVSRIARLLEADGYLERDPATRRYRLGLKVYQLGVLYLSQHSVFGRLTAALDEIALRTGHTAYVGVLEGRQMVFLATRQGTGPLQVVVTPGERIWTHATAAGKALLARLPDAGVRRLLGRRLPGYTADTVRSLPALLRELAVTRRRGYAVMRGEWAPGVAAVGAAVDVKLGARPVAISVGLPTFEATPEVVESLGQSLLKTVEVLATWARGSSS